MSSATNSGPGYRQRPDHSVDLETGSSRVRVIYNGETIADTTSAITVRESGYQPVHYVPAADVRRDLLTKSVHKTYCPFKGEASYWTVDLGGKRAENAVWSYEAPYDEVARIKGYMAFYPNRVDRILID
jgi:uncharacterized protein (DUF427 family)